MDNRRLPTKALAMHNKPGKTRKEVDRMYKKPIKRGGGSKK